MFPRDSAIMYFAGLSFAVHVGLFVGPVGHMITRCAFAISAVVILCAFAVAVWVYKPFWPPVGVSNALGSLTMHFINGNELIR